jgi:hypothetical protein
MTRDVPSVGRFAPAHGTLASTGETLAFESVPDGVRPAEPVDAAPQVNPGGRPFTSDTAREAARRRWELAKVPDFARQELEFTACDTFAPFEEGRRGLLDARAAEMMRTFGFSPSVGVMTTLRGYSWLHAFGECAAVEAAKTGDAEHADRARRFFKDASIELAKAHELMRAEAAARPKSPHSAAVTAILAAGEERKP